MLQVRDWCFFWKPFQSVAYNLSEVHASVLLGPSQDLARLTS
jgi:hypothetical protein